jgi:hypothetical protein
VHPYQWSKRRLYPLLTTMIRASLASQFVLLSFVFFRSSLQLTTYLQQRSELKRRIHGHFNDLEQNYFETHKRFGAF